MHASAADSNRVGLVQALLHCLFFCFRPYKKQTKTNQVVLKTTSVDQKDAQKDHGWRCWFSSSSATGKQTMNGGMLDTLSWPDQFVTYPSNMSACFADVPMHIAKIPNMVRTYVEFFPSYDIFALIINLLECSILLLTKDILIIVVVRHRFVLSCCYRVLPENA
jgi:hypothetical protein